MPGQQLIDYINQCLSQGQTKEQIKQSLLQTGWQEGDIEDAFGGASAGVALQVNNQQTQKFSAKFLIGVIFSIIVIAVLLSGGIYWWQKTESEKQIELKQGSEERQAVALPIIEEVKELSTTQSKFECKLETKEGYIIVSGKVEFPKGIKNKHDYSLVVFPESYRISSDGYFCAHTNKGMVKILGVVSEKNENDFPLMFVINSNKNLDVVVDAYSMAGAMVFMSPFLMTSDPVKADKTISKIKENQKTIELANQIKNKDILFSDDIDEGGSLYQLYIDAINSVLTSLASQSQTINFNWTLDQIEYRENLSHTGPWRFLLGKIIQPDQKSISEYKEFYFDLTEQLQFVIDDKTNIINKNLIKISPGQQIAQPGMKAEVSGYLDKQSGRLYATSIQFFK